MGRGMGMGRGMAMNPGMNPGMQSMYPPQPGFPQAPQQMTPGQEVQMLKDQAELMKQQLDQILNRINDIEKK